MVTPRRCGNDCPVDRTERGLRALGNHAQNARFPLCHSASSSGQGTNTSANRGHAGSVISGLAASALTAAAKRYIHSEAGI